MALGIVMVATRSISWINARPWLVGVLLSAAGMLLGYDLGSETARLLGGEPAIWARMGKGLVWGGVMAALQWPIVRALGVHLSTLFAVSAVGFAVGYPLGQTIQSVIVQDRSLNWIWGYLSALAAFGFSLGISQWWVFRRKMQRSSLWILFSMIGWLLTGVAWLSFRAGDGLDSVAYGVVSGLGLVWLVSSQPMSNRKP
jgi:hypothetical protein